MSVNIVVGPDVRVSCVYIIFRHSALLCRCVWVCHLCHWLLCLLCIWCRQLRC